MGFLDLKPKKDVQTYSIMAAEEPVAAPKKQAPAYNFFLDILPHTLKMEGGYTVDQGGSTYKGITQNTYNAYRTSRKRPTLDVRDMPGNEISDLYYTEYFKRPGYQNLPKKTAGLMFDMGVNAGPGTATKILQGIVGAAQDGNLGPKTRTAIQNYLTKNGEDALGNEILKQRLNHYNNLIQKNPAKYKGSEKGWKNRLKEIRKIFEIPEAEAAEVISEERKGFSKFSPKNFFIDIPIKYWSEKVESPYGAGEFVTDAFGKPLETQQGMGERQPFYESRGWKTLKDVASVAFLAVLAKEILKSFQSFQVIRAYSEFEKKFDKAVNNALNKVKTGIVSQKQIAALDDLKTFLWNREVAKAGAIDVNIIEMNVGVPIPKKYTQPTAGGLVANQSRLSTKELENLKTLKPDVFILTRLDRDVTVTLGDKTKNYKKGEEIYIYQDSSTGKAIVKDGDYGVLPNKEVKKVEAAGRKIKEFAPELEQVEEVVKGSIESEKLEKERLVFRDKMYEKYEKDYPRIRNMSRVQFEDVLEGNEVEKWNEYNLSPLRHATKFHQYQLPGGENYREVLIKASPTDISPLEQEIKDWYSLPIEGYDAKKEGRIIPWDELSPSLKQSSAKVWEKETGRKAPAFAETGFKSSHWDEPNVLAHLRMNDRTTPDGKKVLFVEELQSDWAKQLRTTGEKIGLEKLSPEEKQLVETWKKYRTVASEDENTLNEALKKIESGVPFHPLLKNWQELALKRALKEAVEGGYDYISWTTGEQQAERYDLSRQVKSIGWEMSNAGTYFISATDTEGTLRPIATDIPKDKIADYVGKDAAEKILKKGPSGRLNSVDLKIGGEWAKNLYDRQVPNILKDLTKGSVENIKFDTNKETSDAYPQYKKFKEIIIQPALKITPEIRRLVTAQPIAGGNVPLLAGPAPDKIRAFIMTVKEAQKTSPEVAAAVMSRYTPITNQATLTEAQLLVAKDANEAYRLAMEDTPSTPLSNAVAVSLVDSAQQAGRWEEAKAIVEKTAERNTAHGQAIQALAMYERLSPEGILRYAESVLRKASEDMPDKLLKFQRLSGGMSDKEKTRLAKELKVPYMSEEVMQDLYDRAIKISQMEPGRPKQIEVALLLKRISREIPKDVWTKVSIIQTMSQLLNPKTIVRNLLGNAGFWATENLAETVGTALDSGLSFMTGKRTQYLPNLSTQFKGLKKGWEHGIEEAMLGIDLGKEAITKYDLPQNSVFDEGVLSSLEKTLSIVLRAPDKAFYTSAFNSSLENQMKVEGVTEPTFEMIETAHLDGLYKTFQDDSALSEVFTSLKRAMNKLTPSTRGKWGLGDMILKYPKTPANILSRALEYSPVGFFSTVYQMAQAATKKGFDQAKFVKDTSRAFVGTSIYVGIGALLGALGIITGRREEDPETANLQQMLGIGSYRINLSALKRFAMSGMDPLEAVLRPGDFTISYDWFLPNAINIAIGANLAHHDNANLVTAVLESSEALIEQPMVQGLRRLTQGENIIASIGAVGKDILPSFVPTLLNQVKQLTDNISRNTRDPNYLRETYNKVIYKVPILSKTLEPRIGPFGKEQEIYPGSSNNPFNVFLNPAFVSKYNPPDEAKLVLDIWKETGETIQMPRKVPNSIRMGGETRKLTSDEQRAFGSYIGNKTGVLFNILYHDPLFMSQPADTRAKRLQGFLTDIYTAAKIEILGYKPKSTSTNVIGVMKDLSNWWKKDAYRREKMSNPKRGFLGLTP